MRAMILAAGRGERLRPLTDSVPKPLIEAGGKPLVAWHLERLAPAGIRDVVINVSHLAQRIESVLGDGGEYGLRIRYSREPEGALETGGGIRQALPLLGEEPFLLLNGDVWTDLDLRRLPQRIPGRAHLVLVPNPPGKPRGDFALQDDKVRNDANAGLTYAGIAVLSPELVAGHPPGRFSLAPLLRCAAEAGEVTGQRFDGAWFDVGVPQRLEALREHLAGGAR